MLNLKKTLAKILAEIESLKSKFPVESGNLDTSYIDGLAHDCMTGGYINYPYVYVGWGIVLTVQWTTSMHFFQVIIGNDGSIHTRSYIGGAWGTWNNKS